MSLFMFLLKPVFVRNACRAGFCIFSASLTVKQVAADENSIFGVHIVLHPSKHSPLVREQLRMRFAIVVDMFSRCLIFSPPLRQFVRCFGLHTPFGGGLTPRVHWAQTVSSVSGANRSPDVIGFLLIVLVSPCGPLVILISPSDSCIDLILGTPLSLFQWMPHQCSFFEFRLPPVALRRFAHCCEAIVACFVRCVHLVGAV